ncbi:unnamed protein product [Hydatigera taeniaeformis]|uniref:PPE family protein n=1 Tax=Hydatigena taeniaeformis TaxID=6205 RepID=A0A0R3WIE8_HYDTA|nr:unnamed protein product [Hydatigera taeniaeformis]
MEHLTLFGWEVLDVAAVPQVIAVLTAVVAAAMAWVGVVAVMVSSVVADAVPMAEGVFVAPAVHPAAAVVQAVGAVVASKLAAVPVSTTVDEVGVAAAPFKH